MRVAVISTDQAVRDYVVFRVNNLSDLRRVKLARNFYHVLIATLKSRDDYARAAAAEILSGIKAVEAIPYLEKARAKDPDHGQWWWTTDNAIRLIQDPNRPARGMETRELVP